MKLEVPLKLAAPLISPEAANTDVSVPLLPFVVESAAVPAAMFAK
jgi:hypothetical protein